MADSARVKFSFAEGLLEVEGSETFVSTQLERLQPILDRYLSHSPNLAATAPVAPSARQLTAAAQVGELSDYENVFALADGKIQILKNIPGANKAQKTVNVALLLAFANQLQGINSVNYSTIRDVCSVHACLDGGNFSKTLKSEKELFLVSGSGSAQAIALTVPGKRKAAELANSLKS